MKAAKAGGEGDGKGLLRTRRAAQRGGRPAAGEASSGPSVHLQDL